MRILLLGAVMQKYMGFLYRVIAAAGQKRQAAKNKKSETEKKRFKRKAEAVHQYSKATIFPGYCFMLPQ